MADRREQSGDRRGRGPLISQRTAVAVIAILFGASAAGWLTTEFVPPDLPAHREVYVQNWGEWTVSVVDALRLYDPFHSFWYSGVLALFFVVLLLCLASRWRSFLGPALRLPAPGPLPLSGDGPRFEVRFDGRAPEEARADPLSHYGKRHGAPQPLPPERAEAALSILRRVLHRRGYRLAWRREGETVLFSAVAGRWRSLGSFVFHAGLLVITVGGVMGSRMGSSEILYGARGDMLPLAGSGLSIRVDDFRIIYAENGRIRDYISDLTILDKDGKTVAAKQIEVNHPLRHGGYSILQSSYYIAEDEFEWVDLRVTPEGGGPPVAVRIVPGERVPVPGTGLTVRAGRFKPDFRMIGGVPRSVSGMMNNPALELMIEGSQGRESGWIFPLHPKFGTEFTIVRRLRVTDLEPRYYTGLEISVNPGAPVLVWGMVMASAGLLALLLWHYRVLRGSMDAEGIAAVGTHARWKVSFREETGRIARELAAAVSSAAALRGKD
jgi:cytochrome c biogenesis protein